MEPLLWLLVVLATAAILWLIVSFAWAGWMLYRVARGYFGDLNDLGGDDGGVRSEP